MTAKPAMALVKARYEKLYKESAGFRQTADILTEAGWEKEGILEEWDALQEDDEAGDDDIPF